MSTHRAATLRITLSDDDVSAIDARAAHGQMAGRLLLMTALTGLIATMAASQGGDTCATATSTGDGVFFDTGTTVGFVDDYDEICPFDAPGSPDVVYEFNKPVTDTWNITLCGDSSTTNYDSKLYIYAADCSTLIACNDDACSTPSFPDPFVSELTSVLLQADTTYYIVVDGYFGDAGDYEIEVTPTAPYGACCNAGPCVVLSEAACLDLGGAYLGDFTTCDPNPCGDPNGACCTPEFCTVVPEDFCGLLGGTYQGDFTNCEAGTCLPGACCSEDGLSCFIVPDEDACLDQCGVWFGGGTDCESSCPNPVGACCVPDGGCDVQFVSDCIAIGGSFLGDGTDCVFDACAANVVHNNTSGVDSLVAGAGSVSSQVASDGSVDSQAADDFVLSEPTRISGARWIGAYFNGDPAPGTGFNIELYVDDGSGMSPTGGPDDPTPAAFYTVFVPWNESDNGNGTYTYEADFDAGVLNAGVRYWISIQAVVDFPPQWGWQASDVVTGPQAVFGFPILAVPYWAPVSDVFGAPTDLAYLLTEDAIGACCLITSCLDTTEEQCALLSGEFSGAGTRCETTLCTGACCFSIGAFCEDLSEAECLCLGGDTFAGVGTACSDYFDSGGCPDWCFFLTCCLPDGACDAFSTQCDCDNAGGITVGGPDQDACDQCPPPEPECPADLDGDMAVGFSDLLSLLASWGPCAGCPQDLDGDNNVGFSDLLQVLSSWGACDP